MPDPFANYDAWLEEPIQRMYAEAEEAEWIAENSTYETDCCGVEVPYDRIRFDDSEMTPLSQTCPQCGQVAGFDVRTPSWHDEQNDDGYYDSDEYYDYKYGH